LRRTDSLRVSLNTAPRGEERAQFRITHRRGEHDVVQLRVEAATRMPRLE
jgi:hypothetical protein